MSSGFTRIIKTNTCINELKFDLKVKSIIKSIYTNFHGMYGTEWEKAVPMTCKETSPEFKMRRSFDRSKISELVAKSHPEFKVTTSSKSLKVCEGKTTILKIMEGEGSRNKKAGGGQTGLDFERQLADDLTKNSDYLHTTVMNPLTEILERNYGIDFGSHTVSLDGSLNQKRNPFFDGSRITVPSGDIGKTVSDITVSSGEKSAYLSLKWSSKFYLANMSLRKHLHADKPNVCVPERNELVKSLGFTPKDFYEPYGLVSTDETSLNHSQLVENWATLIRDILGYGYVYIVSGGKYDEVIDLQDYADVRVISIGSPVYSIPGVRKYSKINLDVLINGKRYNLECQLRGTEVTDVLPYYLRLAVR